MNLFHSPIEELMSNTVWIMEGPVGPSPWQRCSWHDRSANAPVAQLHPHMADPRCHHVPLDRLCFFVLNPASGLFVCTEIHFFHKLKDKEHLTGGHSRIDLVLAPILVHCVLDLPSYGGGVNKLFALVVVLIAFYFLGVFQLVLLIYFFFGSNFVVGKMVSYLSGRD